MFSLDKLLIVIVLYNEKLIDAMPFKNISHNDNNSDVTCYVYDNSSLEDTDASKYPFVKYVHDPTNPGVSYAYNKGAAFAKESGKMWMLLFDQDTQIPDNFTKILEQHVLKEPASELYAMRLFKEGKLISPCGYKFKRGYILPGLAAGINDLNNISFLNSGLLISLRMFFEAGGYDENVPLYFSDFVFINRLRQKINYFTLLDINLQHDLSSNNMTDTIAFKIRYNLYLKGIEESILSEKSGSMFYYIGALLRALKLTYSLKDLYYLGSYLKIFLLKKMD